MKIHWDEKAEWQMNQVAIYILQNFGVKSLIKFRQELNHTTELLQSNPNMCALESLLTKRSRTYRSTIINKLSKMVYYVDEQNETIHIAAFWDCRREPLAQIERLE